MSKELARRIAATPNNAVLDLAGEPMGKIELKSLNGRGVIVRGLSAPSIWMDKVTGLSFEDGRVRFVPTAASTYLGQALRCLNSQDIRFSGFDFRGGPSVNGIPIDTKADSPEAKANKSRNVLGLPVGRGMNFDSCAGITIEETRVAEFHKAFLFAKTSGVIVRDSIAERLRTTGFTFADGSDLTLERNLVRDSTPWAYGGNGDHGDCIHLWTVKGGKPIRGVRIVENLLLQGKGAPMMAIYLDDDGHGIGYEDIDVSRNYIANAHAHGILLEHASGKVEDNVLTHTKRGPRGADPRDAPRIRPWAGSHDLTIRGNVGQVELQKVRDAKRDRITISA